MTTTATRPGALELAGVSLAWNGAAALDGVGLSVGAGERLALLGPSGCGKTTLLRVVAGFARPDRGTVSLDGEPLDALPPHRRPVNLMFQSYALFPHLDVGANVAFGLRREGIGRQEAARRAGTALALVRLDGFERRRPHTLSGGQKQRVALARALVKRPRVLLLDEPLSALDRQLRRETADELVQLQRTLGLTLVTVTHDQEEAMAMATRIAVMDRGRILQVAEPATVWERPATRTVARFIGSANLFEGRVAEAHSDVVRLDCAAAGGALMVRLADGPRPAAGAEAALAVHPDRISLGAPEHGAEGGGLAAATLAGRVEAISYGGGRHLCTVTLGGGMTARVLLDGRARIPSPGEPVTLGIAADAGWLVA